MVLFIIFASLSLVNHYVLFSPLINNNFIAFILGINYLT